MTLVTDIFYALLQTVPNLRRFQQCRQVHLCQVSLHEVSYRKAIRELCMSVSLSPAMGVCEQKFHRRACTTV